MPRTPSPITAELPTAANAAPTIAADQSVGRARRQAEVPRDQVPGDRADQAGEDDRRRDRGRLDDALGDRRRHLGGDEGAGEVEDRRDRHRQPRRQRMGRDRRRDDVRGVVEAVGEVERERRRDDDDEDEVVIHAVRRRLRSSVLDRDALDDVGGGLGGVDRLLEHGEDVLPADHDHRVDAVGEEGSDRVAGDPVAVVLEPVDLDQVPVEVLEPAQSGKRLLQLARKTPTSTSASASDCCIGASIW